MHEALQAASHGTRHHHMVPGNMLHRMVPGNMLNHVICHSLYQPMLYDTMPCILSRYTTHPMPSAYAISCHTIYPMPWPIPHYAMYTITLYYSHYYLSCYSLHHTIPSHYTIIYHIVTDSLSSSQCTWHCSGPLHKAAGKDSLLPGRTGDSGTGIPRPVLVAGV